MKENRKRPASTTRSHALMYLRVKRNRMRTRAPQRMLLGDQQKHVSSNRTHLLSGKITHFRLLTTSSPVLKDFSLTGLIRKFADTLFLESLAFLVLVDPFEVASLREADEPGAAVLRSLGDGPALLDILSDSTSCFNPLGFSGSEEDMI
jgi:hypothetical protein